MKKIILLLGLFVSIASANDYEKVSVEVTADNLNGGAYYISGLSGAATEYEGFISNAGFIVTSEGVVVFDGLGTPSLAKAMLGDSRLQCAASCKTSQASCDLRLGDSRLQW